MFRRAQLKALVDIHSKDEGMGGNLSSDEILIIRGALDLSRKTAADCMTPLDKASVLNEDGPCFHFFGHVCKRLSCEALEIWEV